MYLNFLGHTAYSMLFCFISIHVNEAVFAGNIYSEQNSAVTNSQFAFKFLLIKLHGIAKISIYFSC